MVTLSQNTIFLALMNIMFKFIDCLDLLQYIMIFEANRHSDIEEVMLEFPEDVLHIGYFDSMEPETAKKVAKNVKQLDRLGAEKVK